MPTPKKKTSKKQIHDSPRTGAQTDSLPGSQWWAEGLRFQCQGSGQCCTSHGEYGFVFMTVEDRQRMAGFLGLSLQAFTKKFCDRSNGFYHLKEDGKNLDCLFLRDRRCSVYEARPTQCRTWPFWPDVMKAKTWKKEVVTFCPGVGKGPLIPARRIRKILQEQIESEKSLDREAQFEKSLLQNENMRMRNAGKSKTEV